MENQRKKILCLIPNLGMGGAQRVFSNINSLLADQHEVVACAFSKETGYSEFDSFETHFLEVGAGRTLLGKFTNFFKRIIKLRRLKKELIADICISHMEGANFVNILSGLCKMVIVLHGSKLHDEESNSHFGRITTFLIRFLYNKVDRIVTVSEGIKEELVSHYGIRETKCKVINNFFDFVKIQELAEEKIELKYQFLFNSDDPILIHMGRFHVQKNHYGLVNIFNELKEVNDRARLILLGSGELQSHLVGLSKERNMRVYKESDSELEVPDADIYFLGVKENPYKYLKASNVFVFPSSWEGFPMALCEAIICGVKVVTSDCPTGPMEIMFPNKPNNIRKNYSSFGYILPIPMKELDFREWSEKIQALLSINNENNDDYFEEFRQLKEKISIEYVNKEWMSLIANI